MATRVSPVRGPDVMTTGEVAKLLRVSQQTVIRSCDDGSLKYYRVPGSKHRRITRAEAVAFAERFGIPVGGA